MKMQQQLIEEWKKLLDNDIEEFEKRRAKRDYEAYSIAKNSKYEQFAKLLYCPRAFDEYQKRCFVNAAIKNDTKTIKSVIHSMTQDTIEKALSCAVFHGHVSATKLLFNCLKDISVESKVNLLISAVSIQKFSLVKKFYYSTVYKDLNFHHYHVIFSHKSSKIAQMFLSQEAQIYNDYQLFQSFVLNYRHTLGYGKIMKIIDCLDARSANQNLINRAKRGVYGSEIQKYFEKNP